MLIDNDKLLLTTKVLFDTLSLYIKQMKEDDSLGEGLIKERNDFNLNRMLALFNVLKEIIVYDSLDEREKQDYDYVVNLIEGSKE